MNGPARWVLAGLRAVLLLAVLQLLLSLVLVQQYAAWFRGTHPGTPTLAVVLALLVRSVVAIGWVSSYRAVRGWLRDPGPHAGRAALVVGLVLVAGYLWLLGQDAPWWLTPLRGAQLAVLAGVVLPLLHPAVRDRLAGR